MPVLLKAGRHVLEVEEPNLVIYRLRGILSGEDLRAMRKAQSAWMAGKGYVLGLVDVTEMEGSTSDARQDAMREDDGPRNRAMAYFGTSFAVRVMVELSFRAMRLVRSNHYQMRFCEDEASARRWLEAQRPDLVRRMQG